MQGLKNSQLVYMTLILVSILIPVTLMSYKLYVLDYTLTGLIPAVSYKVETNFELDGHGNDVSLSTYLPKSDSRQQISDERNESNSFYLTLQSDSLNRMAEWQGDNIQGRQNIRYSYSVLGKHIRYNIPKTLGIPTSYAKHFDVYLKPEPGIQVDDPLIQHTLNKIISESNPKIFDALHAIHRYLQDKFENKNFSGFTDALTTLKLGEASCNGKGRLFVALARKLNLPARLVGGLILKSGSKRTSHQWVEVYINGHWVPFDTINDYFAEIPAHFLSLYYGDLVLFKHSSNINFQYFFKISKRLVPKGDTQEKLKASSFNITNIYSTFERVGISQNLLKILLMIPLGALVVVIFRNVIGIETFGTFLPALIAAAARETGLLWGLIGFTLIIVISSFVRKILDWVQLLHSPKMSIMLTTVVIVMLLMTIFGVHFGLFELAHITLFPIAILAITAERFAILEIEQGSLKAFKITFSTLIVISACYMVMDSLFLQSMILAFPELLFLIIALNLWLGKWIGMRLSEFYRFRKLILGKQRETA